MRNTTNKFGVPYHSYTLTLANSKTINFDMAWEEYWGNVSRWNEFYDGGEDNYYVGYGNEEDGYVEIVRVFDEENYLYDDVWDFLKECEKWVDNYSE